jgi:hypothetical protein
MIVETTCYDPGSWIDNVLGDIFGKALATVTLVGTVSPIEDVAFPNTIFRRRKLGPSRTSDNRRRHFLSEDVAIKVCLGHDVALVDAFASQS